MASDAEVLRSRVASGLPDGYLLVYFKPTDHLIACRVCPNGGTGDEVLRRKRPVVARWRDPARTMAFAVRDAERRGGG